MAGFKTSILDKSPVLFLTFDGDSFDSARRTLTAVPAQIIDESGLGNNAIFHDDGLSPDYFGYRMGMPSMVDLEPADQYSMSFGYYGAQPLHPSIWAKTYLEVPHADSFQFPNYGSFSVTAMINKASNENTFRNYYSSNWNTNTLTRPIIRKGLAFKLDYIDPWSGNDYLQVTYPAGTLTWNVYTDGTFFGKNMFVAFSWNVQQQPNGIYSATATLWVNGIVVATKSHTFLDTYPASNVSSPWEIAGTAAASPNGNNYDDRQTSSLVLDQIAVYQDPLTDDDILFLFKKIRSYENMVIAHRPSQFWTLGDLESQTSNSMVPLVGSLTGKYLGGTARILRQQTGPTNIVNSSGTRFQAGGVAVVHDSSNDANPIFNPSGDYTIEFWFTAENGDQSVMMSMQSDNYPFTGMLIQMNTKQDVYSNGMIQFKVTDSYTVSTRDLKDDNINRFQFNDGYWHHCVAIRRGSNIELWLDGVLHNTTSAPVGTIDNSGQLYLMGMMPGELNTTGCMSEFVLYNYALAPAMIRAHYSYALVYRIHGQVTLQGVPYQANVRVYNHESGELIKTIQSNQSDGNYLIDLYDNSLIDLMVLNTQDRNVRYRAYGPITPAEYEDLPA